MKLESFVSSLRNAENPGDLFRILEEKGAPLIEVDGERFLAIVEGDFEGKNFWTEINGEKASSAIGDAMLTSSSFPFKCRRPYTGGNVIFVPIKDIESKEFLVAYTDGSGGSFYAVRDGKAEKISREEYESMKEGMPEFRVKGISDEQVESMGAFFG